MDIVEREISGKVRRFMFGTYTFDILATEFNEKNVNNIMRRIASGEVSFWVSFAFACAKTVCWLEEKEPDFKLRDVYLWADEIGMTEFEGIIAELLNAYKSKNVKAPETTGQN